MKKEGDPPATDASGSQGVQVGTGNVQYNVWPTKESLNPTPLSTNDPQDAKRTRAAKRAKEDYEARQVVAWAEAAGQGRSHIVVSSPDDYPIEQVETRVVVQLSTGTRIEWYGHSSGGGYYDIGGRIKYLFAGERQLSMWTPIIRFVDGQGNRYYQYKNYTECFPIEMDWKEALRELEKRIQNGSI